MRASCNESQKKSAAAGFGSKSSWWRGGLICFVGIFSHVGVAAPVLVESHHVHEGSLYEFGEEVIVQGIVHGDVWVAANEVSIEGVVLGSCFVVAGSLSISGQVQGNVRAVTAQANLRGLVGGNLSVFAAQVLADPQSRCLGEAFIAAGSADLGGRWHQKVRVQAGSAHLDGLFQAPLKVTAGDLIVGEVARIEGPFTYWTRRTPQIAPGAKMLGKVQAGQLAEEEEFHWALSLLGSTGARVLYALLSAMNIIYSLFIGLTVLWMFPQALATAVHCLRHRPGASLGMGLFALIVVPTIAFLLLLTVLGIPVALTVLALNVFGLYTAKVVVMYWTGMMLMPKRYRLHRVSVLLLGIAAYFLITSVPVVGNALAGLSMAIGLGATLLSYRHELKTH